MIFVDDRAGEAFAFESPEANAVVGHITIKKVSVVTRSRIPDGFRMLGLLGVHYATLQEAVRFDRTRHPVKQNHLGKGSNHIIYSFSIIIKHKRPRLQECGRGEKEGVQGWKGKDLARWLV